MSLLLALWLICGNCVLSNIDLKAPTISAGLIEVLSMQTGHLWKLDFLMTKGTILKNIEYLYK